MEKGIVGNMVILHNYLVSTVFNKQNKELGMNRLKEVSLRLKGKEIFIIFGSFPARIMIFCVKTHSFRRQNT